MVSIKIEDLPDEELRVVTQSFSYLKRSGCKNELIVSAAVSRQGGLGWF